jgi:hypothetical protein
MSTSTAQHTVLADGAVARRYGVGPWQVRRLFERGLLPPAPRIGAYRVIAGADLPRNDPANVPGDEEKRPRALAAPGPSSPRGRWRGEESTDISLPCETARLA